jgi:hypothetical protein
VIAAISRVWENSGLDHYIWGFVAQNLVNLKLRTCEEHVVQHFSEDAIQFQVDVGVVGVLALIDTRQP